MLMNYAATKQLLDAISPYCNLNNILFGEKSTTSTECTTVIPSRMALLVSLTQRKKPSGTQWN